MIIQKFTIFFSSFITNVCNSSLMVALVEFRIFSINDLSVVHNLIILIPFILSIIIVLWWRCYPSSLSHLSVSLLSLSVCSCFWIIPLHRNGWDCAEHKACATIILMDSTTMRWVICCCWWKFFYSLLPWAFSRIWHITLPRFVATDSNQGGGIFSFYSPLPWEQIRWVVKQMFFFFHFLSLLVEYWSALGGTSVLFYDLGAWKSNQIYINAKI